MRKLTRDEFHVLRDAIETLQALAFEGDERRADFDGAQSIGVYLSAVAEKLAEEVEQLLDSSRAPAYPDVLAHLNGEPDLATLSLMEKAGHAAVAWRGDFGVMMQPLRWPCWSLRVPNWEVAVDLAKAMDRS